MSNLINTAAPINEQIQSINEATASFDADFNAQRAQLFARYHAFSQHYMSGAGSALELATAMRERQVPAADASKGQNPFLPIIRILAGRFDTTPGVKLVEFENAVDLVPFIINDSWNRRASVLRHLHDHKVAPEDAAAYILNYGKGTNGPKMLNGIMKADLEKYGIKRPKVTKEQIAQAIQLAKVSDSVMAEGTEGVTGLRMMWVHVENNMVRVGGLVPHSEQAAVAAAGKYLASYKPKAVAVDPALQAMADKQAAAMAAHREGEAA